MATALIRSSIKDLINEENIHAGWWLQRGWAEYTKAGENSDSKLKHLEKIVRTQKTQEYSNAVNRWIQYTVDETRFKHLLFNIETRLLTGISANGALETGCAIHHTYGMPYIPGSALKGVVRAYAKSIGLEEKVINELFGDDTGEDAKSGIVHFYDTWWQPTSNISTPFVLEVVTPHHSKYYTDESATTPDLTESPVPNYLLAVQGAMLVTIETLPAWSKFTSDLLIKALEHFGIGAKINAGYGLLKEAKSSNLKNLIEEIIKSKNKKGQSVNMIEILDFENACVKKSETNNYRRAKNYGSEYQVFAAIIKKALENNWLPEEKLKLYEVVQENFDKIIEITSKDKNGCFKKLKLNELK